MKTTYNLEITYLVKGKKTTATYENLNKFSITDKNINIKYYNTGDEYMITTFPLDIVEDFKFFNKS